MFMQTNVFPKFQEKVCVCVRACVCVCVWGGGGRGFSYCKSLI